MICRTLFRRFFPNNFSSHYSCVSEKIVWYISLSPFFWTRYSCVYRKRFVALFPTIFSQHFFLTLHVFLEKLFRAFSPPIFKSRYSCEYKIRFFALFPTIYFPTFFLALFVCFWKNCFSRFFHPFYGHDIRVNTKHVFFSFFSDDIFPFFVRTIRVFLEKLFRAFFVLIFSSRYSCEYKKRFFALFTDDFFPTFLARSILVFL